MLKTGEQHLESLRDGRRVYIGDELVEDVTTHPAFRNAAQSFAMIYDRKRDPENIGVMAYEDEDGELSTSWYLKPKSREQIYEKGGKLIAVLPNGLVVLLGDLRITSPAL